MQIGSQWYHHVGDAFLNTNAFGCFEVYRYHGNAAAGADSRGGRKDIVSPEQPDPITTISQKRVQAESEKDIHYPIAIVQSHRLGINAEELRTHRSHLIGKICSQTDRSQFHHHNQGYFHHLVAGIQKLAESSTTLTRAKCGQPNQERKDDKSQHMLP